MTPSRRSRFVDRLYALLLRAYPRRFRARFAREMTDAVQSDHAQARERGLPALTTFWTRTTAEAVYFGLAERQGPAEPRPSRWAIDWRDAYRSLRATPVVTIVAMLSLGLGIGANTTLFSILNSLVLKTLPVRDPDRLVVIADGSWTNPIWEEIRDRRVFHDAFAWSAASVNLSSTGESDQVPGVYASGEMFDVLGVHPIIGRAFSRADDSRTGGPYGPVAVVSEGFWQRRYGGRADILGQGLTVNGLRYAIVGVTPKGFFGPDVGRAAEVFLPIGDIALEAGSSARLDARSNWWLEIMARLAPGQTIEQATAALRRAQPAIRLAAMPQDWPTRQKATFLTDPFALVPAANGESELRTSYRRPLEVLLAVVGSVLLIACANIANLLLARAAARQREFSLRLALGASRARLARLLLTESAMLAATGALLGLAFARWGGALLVHQLSGRETVMLDLSPDWRVLAFTAGLAVVTVVLFGLAPAIGVAQLDATEALKQQGRGLVGERRGALRSVLVIGQVALSLALVLAAALFLRTFASLTRSNLGFDPTDLLVINVNASKVSAETMPTRLATLLEDVQAVPGVARAALSALTPVSGSGWNTIIEPPPYGPEGSVRRRLSWVNAVSPGWFATYGIHLLQGRDIDTRDTSNAPAVVVVDETFAHKFLAGKAVLGAELHAALGPGANPTLTVIGEVTPSVYRSARAGDEPVMYLPLAQPPAGSPSALKALNLSVRSSGEAAAFAPAVSRAIRQAIPEAAFSVRLMDDQLGGTVRQERLLAILGGFFGGLALLLAALGLYGVTSYSVNRQRAEIGIRMALGADRAGIIRRVVGRVVLLLAIGAACGSALCVWASKFIAQLLFGVTPRDPLMMAGATAVLLGAALAAAWLPARRAGSMDPAKILREGSEG